MPTESEISKQIEKLLAEVPSLRNLATKNDEILTFGERYQYWYSSALRLVELLGQDRLAEFRSYYEIDSKRKSYSAGTYVIQDYVKGMAASKDYMDQPNWDTHTIVAIRLTNQSQILSSLKSRLGNVLSEVKGHLLAEIEDEKLALRSGGHTLDLPLTKWIESTQRRGRKVIRKEVRAIHTTLTSKGQKYPSLKANMANALMSQLKEDLGLDHLTQKSGLPMPLCF